MSSNSSWSEIGVDGIESDPKTPTVSEIPRTIFNASRVAEKFENHPRDIFTGGDETVFDPPDETYFGS